MNSIQADAHLASSFRRIWDNRTVYNSSYDSERQIAAANLPQDVVDMVIELYPTPLPPGGEIRLDHAPVPDARFLKELAANLRPSGCFFTENIVSFLDEGSMYRNFGPSSRTFVLSPNRVFNPDRMHAYTPCTLRFKVASSPVPLIASPTRIGAMVQRLNERITFEHICTSNTSTPSTSFTRDMDIFVPEFSTMLEQIFDAANTQPGLNWGCSLLFTVPESRQIRTVLWDKVRQMTGIGVSHSYIVDDRPTLISIRKAFPEVPSRTMELQLHVHGFKVVVSNNV